MKNFTIIIRHFISYYNLHGVVMGILLNMGFASHKSIYSVKTKGSIIKNCVRFFYKRGKCLSSRDGARRAFLYGLHVLDS